MKKNFSFAVIMISLVLSGCTTLGTGNTGTATTTSNTQTSVLTSAGTSVLGTLLTTLLGNTTSQSTIVGTWTYSSPKVTFKSESVLAQIGSSVASSKIESTLGSQLSKLGFQQGKTTLTFASDGSCQMVRNGKTFPGTYSYNTSTGVMTIQGALGVTTINPYVSVVGNELYMMFEADKLLSVMTTVSSATKTSTITNLLGNYNGLQLGWTMVRQ